MRALCLLALIGATLTGCCSKQHRAWRDGYNGCVSQSDDCCEARGKSRCSKKRSARKHQCNCSSCSDACNIGCSDCGGCGSGCGSEFGDCSSCGGGEFFSSGCSSCDQGQMVYGDTTYSSMPSGSTNPTFQQNQMSPTPAPSSPASAAPIPPAPPATTKPEAAPEPNTTRMMQPLQMQPVLMPPQQMQPLQTVPSQPQNQSVQYQDWQSHQQQTQSIEQYNPPVGAITQPRSAAVQPVLWVPAQAPPATPMLLPAR